MKENWKFSAVTGEAHIPYLHDCIATKIAVNGSEMTLDFPDGFWLLPDDPQNPYDEPHRTGPSRMIFSLLLPPGKLFSVDDSVRLELFREYHLHPIRLFPARGPLLTTCTCPKVEKIMQNINSGKWELEFVYKYTQYRGCIYECYIRTNRNMYRCYLTVDYQQIRFFWNEVLEDRVW